MIRKINKTDILKSIRSQLERQRILEKEGFIGLAIRQAKKFDEALKSPTVREPYIMSDACRNIINYYDGKI